MGQGITEERRKRLKEILALAEPYTPDDPEWNMFDGDPDLDRLNASIAKKILDENPE